MNNRSSILPIIGFIEFFERFGFYTLQGLIIIYLIKRHHFSHSEAYHIFGAFSALLYAFVGIGGWCGDNIFGPQKTLVMGLVIMLTGYLGLCFYDKQALFASLAAICLGNALFKANPSAILGHACKNTPEKLHAYFTFFYMTINLGALVALLMGPYLANTYGYSCVFLASAIGISIALLSAIYQRNILLTPLLDKNYLPLNPRNALITSIILLLLWQLIAYLLNAYHLVAIGLKFIVILALGWFLKICLHEHGNTRCKLFATLILMLEAIIFFTLYQQMPTSINIYAIKHVHNSVFGLHFDAQSFQALNPFWIIILSPMLANFYKKNTLSNNPWSIFKKFSIGMLCCTISYCILYLSHFFADATLHISCLWLIVSYIFQAIAELMVSALGLAMVAELVPSYRIGGVMGMWFLTSAISGFTGAKVAILTVPPTGNAHTCSDSLQAFANVFGGLSLILLAITIIMFMTIKYLERLTGIFDAISVAKKA